jgi:hypothetical protein
MPPRKRLFTDLDAKPLLEQLGEMRRASTTASAKAPVRGELYLALERLDAAIDDVAGVITGRREHFHAPPHTADTAFRPEEELRGPGTVRE